ncbi:MAG TPA: FecR domain-containing protein [Puia sp.]|nr:FecR domain-containing protein [Puia sp.]
MRLQEAQEFVARFNQGAYSPEENAAFLEWLSAASENELTIIADTHESMHGSWVLLARPSDEWVRQMERKLDGIEEGTVPVVPLRKKSAGRVRWVAAASVAILLSAGSYYFYAHRLQVSPAAEYGQSLSMTVSSPRGGGQKAIELPDGSKVWLNPGSVLQYPKQFADGQRLVALEGEAFFDVTGTAARPFQVRIKDAEVDVLGTFFDVMAYADEESARTTVLSGSLKITGGHQTFVVGPGEEAVISHPSPGAEAAIALHSGVDVQRILDWKAGIYRFKATDLRTILRVLARNYNLTIQYRPGTPDPVISGSLDLHKELKILLEQLSEILPQTIHITSDEKVLTVSST